MSGHAQERRTLPPLLLAALIWGFAEATLFFVVADVVIAWTALRRGLRAGFLAALLASLGAAAGGVSIHAWSAWAPLASARTIEAVPAIPAGAVAQSALALRREGLAAPLAGSFSGMPYKVWSAAAPHAGWSAPGWALAAFPVRLPRFVLVALAFAALGRLLRPQVSGRGAAALFAAGWTIFYTLYWALSPW